jgi:hypothetical protein
VQRKMKMMEMKGVEEDDHEEVKRTIKRTARRA